MNKITEKPKVDQKIWLLSKAISEWYLSFNGYPVSSTWMSDGDNQVGSLPCAAELTMSAPSLVTFGWLTTRSKKFSKSWGPSSTTTTPHGSECVNWLWAFSFGFSIRVHRRNVARPFTSSIAACRNVANVTWQSKQNTLRKKWFKRTSAPPKSEHTYH
jgi:hypothetical protein